VVGRFEGALPFTLVLMTIITVAGLNRPTEAIAQERGFFGVIRVERGRDFIQMVHGTTTHGGQYRDPERRMTPPYYYHVEGPMGSAVAQQQAGARIGVIGLGTGALAAHLAPGQEMVFHEIDPLVVRLAREHFTFLRESSGSTEVLLGDGRLTLERLPDDTYDMLVVDAFSSDFIPTHLLTHEALLLYLSKVRSGGMVLLHISNRAADLRRVVRGFQEETGYRVVIADHTPSAAAHAEGATASLVAAIAPDPATLKEMAAGRLWRDLDVNGRLVRWSDDRRDMLRVLK
jgi:spermidine synthase